MGLSRTPLNPACIAEEVVEFAQLPKGRRDQLKKQYEEDQKQKADKDLKGSGDGSGGGSERESEPEEKIEIELREEFEQYPEEVQKKRYRPPAACHKDPNYT